VAQLLGTPPPEATSVQVDGRIAIASSIYFCILTVTIKGWFPAIAEKNVLNEFCPLFVLQKAAFRLFLLQSSPS